MKEHCIKCLLEELDPARYERDRKTSRPDGPGDENFAGRIRQETEDL